MIFKPTIHYTDFRWLKDGRRIAVEEATELWDDPKAFDWTTAAYTAMTRLKMGWPSEGSGDPTPSSADDEG